ncbi:MAG TPA: hypothetical protein VER03_17745 [Bryobacteraceae bacterium]|nr:hypothetical protein [Bryobacteraceae bacterium]
MDGFPLLRQVAEAYRNLKTLSVEAVILTEQGDEDSSSTQRQRFRFFYAAPNFIRFERLGPSGVTVIADGVTLHTLMRFSPMRGIPRYTAVRMAEMAWRPHAFRPEFSFAPSDALLFDRIAENVTRAEIVREEEGCSVVSVSYERHEPPHFLVPGPSILFWIDSKTRMVMRQQSTQGHRHPEDEEVNWSQHTTLLEEMRIDAPLAEGTFVCVPPPDVEPETGSRCGIGSGRGFALQTGKDGYGVEHRGSHHWDDKTFVEDADWKLDAVSFHIQRRFALDADAKSLRVEERITGPTGEEKAASFTFRIGTD